MTEFRRYRTSAVDVRAFDIDAVDDRVAIFAGCLIVEIVHKPYGDEVTAFGQMHLH
jgi:hypothetical protein